MICLDSDVMIDLLRQHPPATERFGADSAAGGRVPVTEHSAGRLFLRKSSIWGLACN